MTIVYPDLLENFTASDKNPEIINSFKLPKTKLSVKNNRMIGPALI